MKRQARKKSLSKKLTKIQTKSNTDLERETKKLVAKANARLDSLQRRYKKGTWASKNLESRLSTNKMNMWTKKGKIKVPKNATKTQLIGLNKAINQFLVSKTSTKAGINKISSKTIETFRQNLSTPDLIVSKEDAEKIHEVFYDKRNISNITDLIDPSDLQVIILDSIQNERSEADFIRQLEIYSSVDMNDLDIRETAKYLYEKYVL